MTGGLVFQPDALRLVELMAPETRVPFQYKSSEAIDKFRLMYLLPSEDEPASIECQLVHTSIPGAPSYESLSYTWGDEKDDQLILRSDRGREEGQIFIPGFRLENDQRL